MERRVSELTMELRGAAMRGLVQSIDDSGPMQTVTVITHDGMIRAGIEVYQPFGLATAAVAVGSVVQLAAIGADPGDLIALPPTTPGLRFGNLAAGEVVLYDATGDRVALKQGGEIDILAATMINLTAAGVSIVLTSTGVAITGNVTITGNVAVTGTLSTTGDVTANGKSMDSHTHGNVQNGPGTTSAPL